jgi:transcription elongation GreA/GreB family factor
VALLHRHTNQLDSRKELEAFGNDVERQALDDLSTRAAYIQKDLERIHRRQSRLETCIERATATAPDQCGFTDDVYLASDDEIDNDNDDTTTAQQITSNAGPCQESRKTCRRHRGWIELKRVDIAKELSVQVNQ